MSKMGGYLTMVMAMSMMSQSALNERTDSSSISGVINKPIPKGCKKYLFNSSGEFSTLHMFKTEVVYTCIASSDKSAIKKFNKFIK